MRKESLRFNNDLERHKFSFDNPNMPYLAKLRAENNLDNLVNGTKDEQAAVKRVSHWVSDVLRHNSRGYADDPLTILKGAKEGKSFNCASHSILLQGCLSSLGYMSRTLTIMQKNVETIERAGLHAIVEVFLPSRGKWVMLDPDERIVPSFRADKSLMSTVELQKAITDNTDIRISKRYREFIYPYLFYFSCKFNNRVLLDKSKAKRIILVPRSYNAPKIIEGKWPVKNSTWTHSLATFYQDPRC